MENARERKWFEYVEKFIGSEEPKFDPKKHRRVFTFRGLRKNKNNPDIMKNIEQENGLECRISLETFHLFFVDNSEDYFYRKGKLGKARKTINSSSPSEKAKQLEDLLSKKAALMKPLPIINIPAVSVATTTNTNNNNNNTLPIPSSSSSSPTTTSSSSTATTTAISVGPSTPIQTTSNQSSTPSTPASSSPTPSIPSTPPPTPSTGEVSSSNSTIPPSAAAAAVQQAQASLGNEESVTPMQE
jgi:hypothetical protein